MGFLIIFFIELIDFKHFFELFSLTLWVIIIIEAFFLVLSGICINL